MNKIYLVWIGQNATTGTPNKLTGRMSNYGHLKAFSSRAKRAEFIDNYQRGYHEFCFAVTRKQARQKQLGYSVALFNEYVNSLEID